MRLFIRKEEKLQNALQNMLNDAKECLADLDRKAKADRRQGYSRQASKGHHIREKYRFLISRLEILNGNS